MNPKEWAKVKIVSCVEAPPLPGQRPKQAVFLPEIPECDAYAHIATGNVYFHFHKFKRKIMIGVGNIKFIEFFWEEDIGKTEDAPRARAKAPEKIRAAQAADA